jgi:tetratricopeptide (TPR) repeat protein
MNGVPALPEVEKIVKDLAPQVLKTPPGEDAIWQIWGPATGGKSTALRLLGEHLAAEKLFPILVGPPGRTLDAGPSALVEAAVGLKQHAPVDGGLEKIRADSTWSDKISSVLEWLKGVEDKAVLLCDEPGEWPSTSPEDIHFAACAEEVAHALLGSLTCRRVVAGELPTGMRSIRRVPLSPCSSPEKWLKDGDIWGDLAPAARALIDCIDADELAKRSPLEIRLLVALVELHSQEYIAKLWATRPVRRDISRALAAAIESQDDSSCSFLKRAWRCLALVRRCVSEDLLEKVVGPAPDSRSDVLLRNCLLYPDGMGFMLHWSLRLDARDRRFWSDEAQEQDVHRQLALHYSARFNQRHQAGDPRALLDEIEAFHHATMSGDDALAASLRPYFAAQLDALGRTLSRDFKKYRQAAGVFERACRWEPTDDYAHHYLAYNLDIVAERTTEVEAHYREAIRLAPQHAWWHSRWITYLVTRGRSANAKSAWSEALDALGLPDLNADPWIYENLHLWVARLLVHRGQLDFAEEVLRAIPTFVLNQYPRLKAVERRLDSLLEARRVGSVFPLNIPSDLWWSSPHLCAERRSPDSTLVRWMPGRVDSIEDGEVHLHVAEPPAKPGSSPNYGFLSIPVAEFDRWSLDRRAHELAAGQFLELAWYGKDADPLIRVHPAISWEDRDLPPLLPDPSRYLRADGWVKD